MINGSIPLIIVWTNVSAGDGRKNAAKTTMTPPLTNAAKSPASVAKACAAAAAIIAAATWNATSIAANAAPSLPKMSCPALVSPENSVWAGSPSHASRRARKYNVSRYRHAVSPVTRPSVSAPLGRQGLGDRGNLIKLSRKTQAGAEPDAARRGQSEAPRGKAQATTAPSRMGGPTTRAAISRKSNGALGSKLAVANLTFTAYQAEAAIPTTRTSARLIVAYIAVRGDALPSTTLSHARTVSGIQRNTSTHPNVTPRPIETFSFAVKIALLTVRSSPLMNAKSR